MPAANKKAPTRKAAQREASVHLAAAAAAFAHCLPDAPPPLLAAILWTTRGSPRCTVCGCGCQLFNPNAKCCSVTLAVEGDAAGLAARLQRCPLRRPAHDATGIISAIILKWGSSPDLLNVLHAAAPQAISDNRTAHKTAAEAKRTDMLVRLVELGFPMMLRPSHVQFSGGGVSRFSDLLCHVAEFSDDAAASVLDAARAVCGGDWSYTLGAPWQHTFPPTVEVIWRSGRLRVMLAALRVGLLPRADERTPAAVHYAALSGACARGASSPLRLELLEALFAHGYCCRTATPLRRTVRHRDRSIGQCFVESDDAVALRLAVERGGLQLTRDDAGNELSRPRSDAMVALVGELLAEEAAG